jgi:hypothetical protein
MARIGLGEITPVKIQLTRENFNALIARHAQPVRWIRAEKCPCAGNNLKIDENCPLCNGTGYTYYDPTESYHIENVVAPIDGVINISGVVWIRDLAGKNIDFTDGDCVAYAPGVLKGDTYTVKYLEDVAIPGSGVAEYVSDGLYRVDLPYSVASGEVQGALKTVTASVGGEPRVVCSMFRNMFQLDIPPAAGTQVDVEYTYVEPFEFALIHNNFTKSDQKFLDEIKGDGLVIFPQRWEISEGDIIIALNATLTEKHVFQSTSCVDNLPSFYPVDIRSAWSICDEERTDYDITTDISVFKGGSIKWISDNGPAEGDRVSIAYTYNPAYKVLGKFPDPRTSENNVFPRKAAIQLLTGTNRRIVI